MHRITLSRHLLPLVACATSAAAPIASAVTINVPSAQAPTITIAINIAANGDEILVAPGSYFEALSFNGKALKLRSTAGPEVTILDGLGQFKPVVRLISGEGATTEIEGFTIRNGDATAAAPGDRGGGIYCNGTSPTIRNCIFIGNQAVAGGAFYANLGNPRVIGCRFIENAAVTTSGDGGAAYLNSTTVDFTDCLFEGNSAVRLGGALRQVATSGTYARCDFVQNSAGANGGAMDMASTPSVLLFRECRFAGNTAGGVGGAVMQATASSTPPAWINCVFDSNEASGSGGAMYVNTGCKADLTNCTLSGNASGASGGGIFVLGVGPATVRNSVVWGNVPTGIVGASATSYTCHQGVIAGAGNIVLDPGFADAANGDLRLVPSSPCLDAGNTTLLLSSVGTDFDGAPRAVNVADAPTGVAAFGYLIDMGAFEFPAATAPTACPGDVNGDGVINGADLGLLLGAWGECP